jgi:sensor histidine kinase YesM
MAGDGRIWLRVYAQEDTVCVSIRDNGAGMSPETIEKVQNGGFRGTEGAAVNGVGMDNVIARLRLFTGSEDVMSILSEGKDRGTEVIIYLPDREREETDV